MMSAGRRRIVGLLFFLALATQLVRGDQNVEENTCKWEHDAPSEIVKVHSCSFDSTVSFFDTATEERSVALKDFSLPTVARIRAQVRSGVEEIDGLWIKPPLWTIRGTIRSHINHELRKAADHLQKADPTRVAALLSWAQEDVLEAVESELQGLHGHSYVNSIIRDTYPWLIAKLQATYPHVLPGLKHAVHILRQREGLKRVLTF